MKRIFLILSALLFLLSCQPPEDTSGLLTYTNSAGKKVRVTTKNWETKRAIILDSLQAAMGKLPEIKNLPAPEARYADTLQGEGYTRYTIFMKATADEIVPAYLYIPKPKAGALASKKYPAMLVLHSTGDLGKGIVDGQSSLENRACGKELAQRGYVVIAPDYPSFGDLSDYDFENDRYESGTMKGIFNHIRCVDFLQRMPEVYPDRIGVIGHSLGGHNAMFVAAFDQRLQVIVSSCGWTQHDYYDIGPVAEEQYGGRLGPYAQDRYMPFFRTKYQLDPARIPYDYHEIIAALAPRPFFSNSPIGDSNFDVKGVEAGVKLASEAYKLFGKEELLHVVYPDDKHNFPPEIREQAYQFIDRYLKK